MNKQELIEKIEALPSLTSITSIRPYVDKKIVLGVISQLDEPETGHADEAPRYVKNILARLRELPLHEREVWLKAIMGEFEQDFSSAKWREGYEQGKVEGMVERDKVTIPQFIADWIEEKRDQGRKLAQMLLQASLNEQYGRWVVDNQDTFARAWLDGYEVEKEKRYWVKLKAVDQYLVSVKDEKFLGFLQSKLRSKFTRKELEDLGFGWVFDCPGIEIEEVGE